VGYLIGLEARAFAAWLPKIAHVHALAFHFRTSLLDLALEANTSAYSLTLKKVTILIVEANEALRAEHVAIARAVAPNATILCAGCYVAALGLTLAPGSPVHLVLAGACVDEGFPLSAAVQLRVVKHFMRAVDPRKGVVHNDMRERLLFAAVSGCAQPDVRAQLCRAGADAALPGGRVTAAALLTLIDFICEPHLGECSSAEPRVPTPVAARILITSERADEELLAVATALEPALLYEKGPPVPTPIAPRFLIAEEVIRPRSRRASSELHLATVGDAGAVAPPTQLAHATLAPLPMFLRWQSREATPPSLGSLRKSGKEWSGVIHPTFPPRAASCSSVMCSQTAQVTPPSLGSLRKSGNEWSGVNHPTFPRAAACSSVTCSQTAQATPPSLGSLCKSGKEWSGAIHPTFLRAASCSSVMCSQTAQATPPSLGSLRKSGNEWSGVNHPTFPRAASCSSVMCSQTAQATPPSLGSPRKSGKEWSGVIHPTFPHAASCSSVMCSQTAQLKPSGGPEHGITPVFSSTAYLQGTVQPAAAPGQFAQIGLAPIFLSMAIFVVLPAGGAETFSHPISPPKPLFTVSSMPNPTGAAHCSSLPQLFDRGGLSRPMPRALS